jgi:multidrug resistance efflux pump
MSPLSLRTQRLRGQMASVRNYSPQVADSVVAIQADDTDFVRAGEELVQLDSADARIALHSPEAKLAQFFAAHTPRPWAGC